MRSFFTLCLVLIAVSPALAADPKWVEGSPSIEQMDGTTAIVCRGTADPSQNQVVNVRMRKKGEKDWQLYVKAAKPKDKEYYQANLIGVASGEYELQFVVMTNAQPPVEVSSSEIKTITVP